MNIHLPAILMWTTGVQGFDTLPYMNHPAIGLSQLMEPLGSMLRRVLRAHYMEARERNEWPRSELIGSFTLWLFNIAMENHHAINR